MKQQHYFNMIKYSKIKQIRRNINHVNESYSFDHERSMAHGQK